jgi:hypothetical protein
MSTKRAGMFQLDSRDNFVYVISNEEGTERK